MENLGPGSSERNAHTYNQALFTNMAHCTDAVWELDVLREQVYIMHDRLDPPQVNQTFTFEQIRDRVYHDTHPEFRDAMCFMFRTDYMRNLCASISFDTLTLIDGSYHILKCVLTPVFDRDGIVSTAYMTIQDIQAILDERGESRGKRTDLQRCLSAVHCGIIQYTDSHRLLFANDMALKLLGYGSFEELQEDSPEGIPGTILRDDAARLKAAVDSLKTEDDVVQGEYTAKADDGRTVIFSHVARLLCADGQKSIIQHSIIDCTAQTEMRTRLESAEQAARERTVFLTSMSHDLRIPMNTIDGYTDLIRSHLDDRQRVLDYLSKINSASRHLMNLINDVLDISRIESGSVIMENTENNLHDMVRGMADMMERYAEEKGLKLLTDFRNISHPAVWCDRLRMNQLVLNCLGTVINGSAPGETVVITVIQTAPPVKGRAVYQFRIGNTATGSIRDSFEHAGASDGRNPSESIMPGTGTGMAVIRDIAEKMNGSIRISGNTEEGREILITVELSVAEVKVSAPVPLAGPDIFKNRYVLLAEDNSLNREIATVILEDAGATVDTAENGLEAVQKVENCSGRLYDLILMDIQMPIMNGYRASREIRMMQDSARASIPIVAMTANTLDEDRQKASDAGMNAHIAKPIQIDTLFETIAELLR